jgi:hypothetical protein
MDILVFSTNVNKKWCFSHFVGFSRSGALCLSASFYYLGLENMEGIKEYDLSSLPIGEFWEIRHRNLLFSETVQLRKYSLNHLTPEQYLSSVKPHIPEGLISDENYVKMKKLASYFTTGVTSFFGFETRLDSPNACADYLFAISSMKGEREAFVSLLQNENEEKHLLQKQEWQYLLNFAATWADPKSELYTNVLGLWLEFDIAEYYQKTPIPCAFIHTIPLRIRSIEEEKKYDWVFHSAVPLLLGHSLSFPLHQRLLQALRQIPEGASVMDIGFMLSRSYPGVRLVFKHLHPTQIIPYLNSLGWSDVNNELTSLLEELQQQVTRLILHITITEQGVDPKIGLECSFSPDQYQLETRWEAFFDYLYQKGVCCREKKTEVLNFLGVSQEDPSQPFSISSYKIAVLLPSEASVNALVRYISHVKLCHKPGQPLEAKAYPGVRLFGLQSPERNPDVC